MPKRGFVNQHAKKYQPVNLERLQHWILEGRLGGENITMTDLLDSRCIHKMEDGVKLLAEVSFNHDTSPPLFVYPSILICNPRERKNSTFLSTLRSLEPQERLLKPLKRQVAV
jgi:hypothetical protein